MIIEHASVTATDGPGFEAAVAEAKSTVFAKAEGWIDLELIKCIETENAYIVAIKWDTLEAHTVTFREGPLFAEWRALVGPFFAAPPSVLHYEIA